MNNQILSDDYNRRSISTPNYDKYDIDFTYDSNTEARGACAATLHGAMFVFGGSIQSRQVISKILKTFIMKLLSWVKFKAVG